MDRILFASPFILERKQEDQPLYPAHEMTQEFVNTLRLAGYQVITVSTDTEFADRCKSLDEICLVIAKSFDGDWLVETIEEVKPSLAVHYFADIPGHVSEYVIQLSQLTKPKALLGYVKTVLG